MYYITGSVKGRINSIKQKKGGYINPSEFEVTDMNDGVVLNESESISPAKFGFTVDYLAKFMRTKCQKGNTPATESFCSETLEEKLNELGKDPDNLYRFIKQQQRDIGFCCTVEITAPKAKTENAYISLLKCTNQVEIARNEKIEADDNLPVTIINNRRIYRTSRTVTIDTDVDILTILEMYSYSKIHFSNVIIYEKAISAFRVSIRGAIRAEMLGRKNSIEEARKLINGIKGLDNQSIINACRLITFNVWVRNPLYAKTHKDYNEINLDEETIQNIQTMVKRTLTFFEKYGEVIKEDFTFEPYGYTTTVSSGKGDFLTRDTLLDFTVSKTSPASKNTLQLLTYWAMGQHSGQEIFKGITKLGLFNPRLNKVYLLDVEKIPKEIIKIVEDDVICYE